MANKFRVLAINPGSTSTKIGLFENDKVIFKTSIEHTSSELKPFPEIKDQYDFRLKTVIKALDKENIDINSIDAFAGRGGSLEPCSGGTYIINDLMYKSASEMKIVKHPSALGIVIAKNLGDKYSKPSFCVNPPDVDEFITVARITGVPGVYRESRIHALNQKEIAIRYAKKVKKNYSDLNLIICHLGGGISIAAHRKGKMIDCNDIDGCEYTWIYTNNLSAGDKLLLKNSKYGDKILSYLDTWEDYVAWYLDGQNVELDSITQDDISYYVTNDYVETKLITPKSTGEVYSDKFVSYTVEVSSPMTVLDSNGNEKEEFKAGEGFKVRIPISEIKDKTINYSIKVKGNFDFEELLLYYMLPPIRYEMPSDSQVYLYQLLSNSAVTRNCSTTKTLKDDIELNFTQKVGDLNVKVIDTSTGNNLSKATVEIEDAKGNIVYRYETTEKDFNVTLPTGNYLVKQTVTPPNYEAITIQMRVSVEENGESNVVLENAPLVNVPDTNMNSYLFIVVGGLIAVAGGIIFGITFRKRRA